MKRKSGIGLAWVLGVATLGVATERPAAAQPAMNVSGTWVSTWGAGQAIVSLTQAGPYATGTFTNPSGIQPGAMAGRFQGNVLTGRWTDATSSGGFQLTFSPDGRRFTGTWGRTLVSTSDGGPWSGHRQ